MVHQQTCRRCGRQSTRGIIEGRCASVAACNRRAAKSGKLRGGAQNVGDSNSRVLRRDLRHLHERVEHVATSWSLMTGFPDRRFQDFVDDVIEPALAYLEEHHPSGQALRYRGLPAEARTARAVLGGLKRSGVPDDDPRYDEARRDLRAAMAANYVRRLLDDWPPLSSDQRSKLAELLRPVRVHGGQNEEASDE